MEDLFSFLDRGIVLEHFIPPLTILLLSVLSYIVVKRFVVRGIHYAINKTRISWDDAFVEHRVFDNLAYLAPAMVIYFGAGTFFQAAHIIQRIISGYVFFVIILIIDRILSAALSIYDSYPISRKRPLKGYVQIIKIFLYVMGGIIVICLLIDQSPWALLSGLGALTAVFLLIFRDTILSFIASLQIITNDLIHVGDWIEMPKYGADGDVIEMALHTVKVQNWDKTITTIPTYKLIDESFKNWRGMTECGGRRIKRALLIDQTSIRFCDEQMIKKFMKIQVLRPYIERKLAELEAYNREQGIDTSQVVNGRRMTNIGTFRAYCIAYLKQHPNIRQDMTFIVRQLAPTPDGLPLEIYVFSNDTAWANYEAIQADIFDHLLAVVPEFGLRVYQRPSGHDLASLAVGIKNAEVRAC